MPTYIFSTHGLVRLAFLLAVLTLLVVLASSAWSQDIAGDWPGYNFLGGDYRNFPALSNAPLNECEQACMDDPECRAFTLVDAGVQGANPVCWLKDSEFEIQVNSRTNSWLKPLYYSAVQGTNFRGPGYDNMGFHDRTGSSFDCRVYCENDPRCKAFTFVEPGAESGEYAAGGMCRFYGEVPEAHQMAGHHSGLVYERVAFRVDPPNLTVGPEHTSQYDSDEVFLPNVNLPGMDYANFEVTSNNYRECSTACAEDPDCRAYTYVRPGLQGTYGRCWLKTGVSARVADNNTASGILR